MKKKIKDLTEEEMEKLCDIHCQKYNNYCMYCPLKIGTDGCFKYVDLDQEIEAEENE